MNMNKRSKLGEGRCLVSVRTWVVEIANYLRQLGVFLANPTIAISEDLLHLCHIFGPPYT